MFTRNSLLRLLVTPVLLFSAFSCQGEKQQPVNPYQEQRKSNLISEPLECNYTGFLQTIEKFVKAGSDIVKNRKDLLNSNSQELYFAHINRCLAVVDEKAFQDPKNWCHIARDYHKIASNVDRRLDAAVNGAAINFHCAQEGQ